MTNSAARPHSTVMWVLWAVMCAAIVTYQVNLGGGMLSGADASPRGFGFPVPLVLTAVAGAAIVRWAILPVMRNRQALLICLIIGLALSEAAEFFGIFLVGHDMPRLKMEIFYLSLASAIQFAPIYVKATPPSSG